MAAFAQFGSDLDVDTKRKLERGKRLYEIFKQEQYLPLPVAKQVLIFYGLINGFLDDVPVEKIRDFEAGLFATADLNREAIDALDAKKELLPEVESAIKVLFDDYKATLDYLIKE